MYRIQDTTYYFAQTKLVLPCVLLKNVVCATSIHSKTVCDKLRWSNLELKLFDKPFAVRSVWLLTHLLNRLRGSTCFVRFEAGQANLCV